MFSEQRAASLHRYNDRTAGKTAGKTGRAERATVLSTGPLRASLLSPLLAYRKSRA